MTNDTPSPFSEHNTNLQTTFDNTSLRTLMFCPRRYQYEILWGYRDSVLELEFGILYHSAREEFWRQRLAGEDKHTATREALRVALEGSVYRDEDGNWTPWSGRYMTMWRCEGTEEYRNVKGNKAKCPYSHKGHWEFGEAPPRCGECGSNTVEDERWISDDPARDRYALVRLVTWYCFEQADSMDRGFIPIRMESGEPALELPVRVPAGKQNRYGEAYVLSGYLDELAADPRRPGDVYIRDAKSTKKTLSKSFFANYAADLQFNLYDLLGWLHPHLPDPKGIIADAAQTMATGARFAQYIYEKGDAQREELLEEIHWWLDQAEAFAEAGHWPMNRANCWACPFKEICAREPAKRQRWLDADFKKVRWNPMAER